MPAPPTPPGAADELRLIARGTPEYRRIALAVLVAGYATFTLLYGVQPLLPVYAREFGVDAAEASLAIALATGPMALALLPASILSDRLGRRPVMIAALFAAAGCTIVAPLLPGWHALLAMRLLVGVSLAGITATALAYLAEEVEATSLGAAVGLYIAGSAWGGMLGRFGMSLMAERFGWRPAMMALGLSSLAAATLFARAAPRSRGFTARRHTRRSFAGSVARLFRDEALPLLFATGFLLMGVFVTLYNYAGFRLTAPPYRLSQTAVGAIFLLYIVGSFASAWAGGLAGRIGPRRVLWMPCALLVTGIALTAAGALAMVIAGIAFVTAAFFAAHSVASGWVGRRGRGDRALAASLYVAAYYLGSSLLSWAGGLVWMRWGWPGIVLYAGTLACAGVGIALRLRQVLPLPENVADNRAPPSLAA